MTTRKTTFSQEIRSVTSDTLCVIRGAGDLASGVAYVLHSTGFRLMLLEIPHPAAVRRSVSFSEAVYKGETVVEGVRAVLIPEAARAATVWAGGCIPVLVDPNSSVLSRIRPRVFVDATLSKRTNPDISQDMADLVIGLGPGFVAGVDVHAVVETKRGHYLGRVILDGSALPDTGIPDEVGGYGAERVLRAPASGVFMTSHDIGNVVRQGDVVGEVSGLPIHAAISGIIRGLLRDGTCVTGGQKVGDVDPRNDPAYIHHISDKARLVGWGVFSAICGLLH
ncbi:MAG: selenium-dependent molybdenum cofactor biosynthesis protein YqeB [Bacillota bacterium]